jgi:protein phosphatase 1L
MPPSSGDALQQSATLSTPFMVSASASTTQAPMRRRSAAVRFANKKAADMDPLLVKANCEQNLEVHSNMTTTAAVCCLQGWRKSMEDAHTVWVRDAVQRVKRKLAPNSNVSASCTPNGGSLEQSHVAEPAAAAAAEPASLSASPLRGHPSPNLSPSMSPNQRGATFIEDDHCPGLTAGGVVQAFVGVYDGHNGAQTAEFLEKHLHAHVARALPRDDMPAADIEEALAAAFQCCDDELRAAKLPGGSTASIVVVLGDRIVLASVGDCRSAVYSSEGAVAASVEDDHSPARNPAEDARIKALGVSTENGRVAGVLAVSRAFGDFSEVLKPEGKPPAEHPVLCRPTVVVHERSASDFFAVVGCDGVWELNTMPRACEIIAAKAPSLDGASAVTLQSCSTLRPLSPKGELLPGNDNVSLGVIMFNVPNDSFGEGSEQSLPPLSC